LKGKNFSASPYQKKKTNKNHKQLTATTPKKTADTPADKVDSNKEYKKYKEHPLIEGLPHICCSSGTQFNGKARRENKSFPPVAGKFMGC